MSSAHYATVKALLDAALEAPSGRREALLAEAPPDIAAEVRLLLDAEGILADDFLDPGRGALILAHLGDEMLGERIGPWRVEAPLGEGGMGRVYTALRDDGAYEQAVALKVVKRGMDTDAVLRRFEAERRILARLAHPGIARLLDGGTTADGRPYFAMALVDGEPITAYADRHALDVPARLRLLLQTAEAVAHAHRHLVVHRDLKPSNVLVASDDSEGGGRSQEPAVETEASPDHSRRLLPLPTGPFPLATRAPRVKLLDFGIARLLEDDGDALTETGLRPMSRPYAAPEQIAGEPITTATDVWALGVLLYELLTGRRPFRADDRAGIETAILGATPTLPSVSASRNEATGTRPGLARRLRGDLDAICLTALARAPEQRYPTADAFAADLRRHLDGLPVEARPPAASYRLRKFVARHRGAVGTAAAALAVLVLGGALYTLQVTRERDRANLEAEKAAQVAAFMGGVFRDADPAQTGGERISARAVLDRARARLEADTLQEPAVRASLHQALGEVYASLALYPEARDLLATADTIRRRDLGPRHPDRAGGLLALASLSLDLGEYARADTLARAAVALRRRGDPAGLALARARLAAVQLQQGHPADAEALLREALTVLAREGRSEDADRVRLQIARALQEQDRGDEAEPLYRQTLAALRARYGDDHPETRAALTALAGLYRESARYDEAKRLYRSALATARRLHGDDHPERAEALRRLGALYTETGDYDRAARLLDRAIGILRAAYDRPNVRLADHLVARAAVDSYELDFEGARALLDEALDIAQADVGEAHPVSLAALNDRAYVRGYAGDLDGAEADYRRVLAGERALRGPVHSEVASTLSSLSALLYDMGRPGEALAMQNEALALRRRILAPDHPELANSLYTLGTIHLYEEQPSEAEAPIAEAARIRRAAFGPADWRTIQADGRLAHIRALLGHANAEVHLRDALARADAHFEPDGEFQWITDQIVGALATFYEGRDEAAAARYRARLPDE